MHGKSYINKYILEHKSQVKLVCTCLHSFLGTLLQTSLETCLSTLSWTVLHSSLESYFVTYIKRNVITVILKRKVLLIIKDIINEFTLKDKLMAKFKKSHLLILSLAFLSVLSMALLLGNLVALLSRKKCIILKDLFDHLLE